jgi:hypothetical protein
LMWTLISPNDEMAASTILMGHQRLARTSFWAPLDSPLTCIWVPYYRLSRW